MQRPREKMAGAQGSFQGAWEARKSSGSLPAQWGWLALGVMFLALGRAPGEGRRESASTLKS